MTIREGSRVKFYKHQPDGSYVKLRGVVEKIVADPSGVTRWDAVYITANTGFQYSRFRCVVDIDDSWLQLGTV